MSNDTSAHDTLWDLIKDIKFGMFTHRHTDGKLHSHPLTTQNQSIDEGATLYFFVPKSGEVATRVAADGNVNLAYAHPGKDSYVSITGSARISQDRATIERLWNKQAEAWFPGGVNDPDLGLLEVRIEDAEYWDITDSKMVQLLKMAKAAVTGTPPDLGEHKTLKVS